MLLKPRVIITDFKTNEVKKRGCDSVSRPIQSGFSVTNQSTTAPQPSMQNPTAPADDFNKSFVLCFQGCKYFKKIFCYSSVIVPNFIKLKFGLLKKPLSSQVNYFVTSQWFSWHLTLTIWYKASNLLPYSVFKTQGNFFLMLLI